MVLQRLGYLHAARAVGVCLYHTHELCFGLHERSVVIQVLNQGSEVHFEHGFVHLLHQKVSYTVKAERTRAFDKDDLVAHTAKHFAAYERVNRAEEELLGHGNGTAVLRYFGPDTDEFLHPALLYQTSYLAIKVSGCFATLEDIAQDERTTAPLMVGPTVHKVECYVKRVDV